MMPLWEATKWVFEKLKQCPSKLLRPLLSKNLPQVSWVRTVFGYKQQNFSSMQQIRALVTNNKTFQACNKCEQQLQFILKLIASKYFLEWHLEAIPFTICQNLSSYIFWNNHLKTHQVPYGSDSNKEKEASKQQQQQ